jgi:hypothetical protein
MPWGDLALHGFALIVYPGALLVAGAGLVAERAAGRLPAVPRPAWRRAADRLPGVPRRAWRPQLPAVAAGALTFPVPATVLLAVLAASQLAIPFNPVSSGEQSVLVAVVALVAAAWVASTRSEPPPRPHLVVLAHICWLIAMVGPAVAAGTMRPAALAAITVPIQLPVKVAAAVLALLCLPAVLQLVPETRPRPPAVAAFALWLPCCGLFASVFLPPAADDPVGIARFGAETIAAAGVALALAAVLRQPRLSSVYWPVLAVLAALTVALAVLALVG